MRSRLTRHGLTLVAAAVALLVVACSEAPSLEDPEAVCPLFSEARDARGGEDRRTTEEAVIHLLGVMPEEFHDEIALWYYPAGGPVGGLNTSGNAAIEAGELLGALYAANC